MPLVSRFSVLGYPPPSPISLLLTMTLLLGDLLHRVLGRFIDRPRDLSSTNYYDISNDEKNHENALE